MAWYKDKVKDNIDVGQAVRDAGRMGEAVSFLGQGMKFYGDGKYNKKRAKIEDAQKDATLKMKKYTADKGYSGKVDSASINKSSSDNTNVSKEKVAGIKYDTEKYKSDSSYKEKIDKEILTNKGKLITAKAKVKSTNITASAKNRATTATSKNTKLSTKTQIEVANINATAKAKKAKRAQKKKDAVKLDLSGSDEDVLRRLKQNKKGNDIGDFEIS